MWILRTYKNPKFETFYVMGIWNEVDASLFFIWKIVNKSQIKCNLLINFILLIHYVIIIIIRQFIRRHDMPESLQGRHVCGSMHNNTVWWIVEITSVDIRLVGGLGRYDHVTPVLWDTLHWLPIRQPSSSNLHFLLSTASMVRAHLTSEASALLLLKSVDGWGFVQHNAATYTCQPQ